MRIANNEREKRMEERHVDDRGMLCTPFYDIPYTFNDIIQDTHVMTLIHYKGPQGVRYT